MKTAISAALGFLICLATLFPPELCAQNDAGKIFKANCVLCHSEDGSGSSATGKALKAKDLRSDEVQKQSDEELAEVISKGKNKMPSFGHKLSGAQIASLVAEVRHLAGK